MLTPEEMNAHVMRVCDTWGITCRVMPGCKIYAYPTLHLIHINPVVDVHTFSLAMHEAGHVVLRHRPEQDRTWKEILAWKWAASHSPEWTMEMDAVRIHCLGCWGIPPDFNPANTINNWIGFR